ncbi:MAG: methanethiol S-methyltransferase [Planctomycetota bacterium]|jgi:protein-S-isoprenylcysteine O-methyltransferase Ste14
MTVTALETRSPAIGRRIAGTLYGVLTYACFAATLVYAICFVTGIVVPKTIDGPATTTSLPYAIAINLALLGLFGIQHTGMARPAFKRWWTRIIPASMERQTYVLTTCLCFGALFLWWQPMTGTVWNVESSARYLIHGLGVFGWALMASSTFLINHFDLFGLRQTWFHARGKPYEEIGFRTPGWYKQVRHPIQLGFIIAFWCTPHMTAGRLLFAAVCTAYILVALQFEERDLTAVFGDKYREYKQRVRMLIPVRRQRIKSWRAASE